MVYIHIGKALYYGSYRAPRRLLWIVGVMPTLNKIIYLKIELMLPSINKYIKE